MNDPLVSIIIPVYNAEKYITETIKSVLNQTWPNKEIIIVDDGSTDQSLKIASAFNSPYIRLFTQENKGASAARNKGLNEAKGDYIQFLDADDLLGSDKIANQVKLLEQNPSKIAVCSTVHFFSVRPDNDLTPSSYEEKFIFDDDNPAHFLTNLWGGFSKHGSMIQPNAWLCPTQVIEKSGLWNEELTIDDDGEFFARVILNSGGIVKSPGYNYYRKYITENSLSAQKTEAGFISRLKALVIKKNLLLEANNSFEAQAAMYKAMLNLAVDTYLIYPAIYKEALSNLPKIKLSYQPHIGGKMINLLCAIFGWKFVKFLRIKLNV